MIRAFTDHAANERTYLAWVRTEIAVIAFGFVIERFNLFLLAVAGSASLPPAQQLRFARLSGPLGRFDGIALMGVGLALIVIASVRFLRTGKLIDDPETHAGNSARGELAFTAVLVIAVIGFTAFLVLG